ncbi:hypothetical protein DASC09_016250 [Saccharomycopsis crataegensis]|uniref:Thioredoxin domain-containing protein n=1 Tax=Saccharomycopsis crataegensis TaxID=43959 RepID=A0AAV5QH92_9ASCO|nr:hypothetical protein DASC09_016250 [Saccharomycopsis crataegensis]
MKVISIPLFLTLFCLSVAYALTSESNILEVTADSLQSLLSESSNSQGFSIVLFFSQSCRYCALLKPIWQYMPSLYASSSQLQLIQIDALKHKVSSVYGIKSFPTLKIFKGNQEISTFEGSRTLENLSQWIQEQTSIEPQWPQSDVWDLESDDKYDQFILGYLTSASQDIADNDNPIVKNITTTEDLSFWDFLLLQYFERSNPLVIPFVAPWMNAWWDRTDFYESVATESRLSSRNVVFGRADVTNANNRKLVEWFHVSRTPTIIRVIFPRTENYWWNKLQSVAAALMPKNADEVLQVRKKDLIKFFKEVTVEFYGPEDLGLVYPGGEVELIRSMIKGKLSENRPIHSLMDILNGSELKWKNSEEPIEGEEEEELFDNDDEYLKLREL